MSRFPANNKTRSFLFGMVAEYVSIVSYLLSFHRILARRYKVKTGEVDFIAKRGNVLKFVEVKGRYEGIYHGIVSRNQQIRIRRAAEVFLMRNAQYRECAIRFDLVVINRALIPTVIKNAF